jgi:hypothetical protein
MEGPGLQVPLWQVSSWVQADLSEQGAPFALVGVEQAPVAGLQVPALWHWLRGEQTTGVLVQDPAWHVSPVVQAFPSLQGVPERGLQTPLTSAPAATEQASQAPASQAVLQQTPSVQKPEVHSELVVHVVPFPWDELMT